jgi:predicted Zn-dependent protease with MMP-like domain
VERADFRKLVREAVALLPPGLLVRVHNVDIVIERRATAMDRKASRIGPRSTLLGLYHGVPLTRRGDNYNLVTPDKISIYQEPIEEMCGDDPDAIREQVRKTVLHELGHYFGISDQRLGELGMG